MKCSKCGNEISEGYDYCPRCGARLKVSELALKEQIEETRHNERLSGISVIIGVILMGVGTIVGLIPTATRREGSYIVTYHPYADAAIFALILSVIFVVMGAGILIYYRNKRRKLLSQLNKIERQE